MLYVTLLLYFIVFFMITKISVIGALLFLVLGIALKLMYNKQVKLQEERKKREIEKE